ncbi:MAG: flagellar hook-length control protein FliK [Proteobacteria bacterium]|uniref:flagellar hook-length control protein FliK n=1 Tax=Aquabacterium sp. TaxID=1872578 RepID=UPI0035C6ED34|nr:flagellar hook-length control protein FliK [Pseudomonadota bacterium]
MNLTLPGLSSPHSPAPAATPRKSPAANEQRFGDALRAAPASQPGDDAVASAQGPVDDSAASTADTQGDSASSPQDDTATATTDAQGGAAQTAGSAAADWLSSLPAQSAPLSLGLPWGGLAAATVTGKAQAEAAPQVGDTLGGEGAVPMASTASAASLTTMATTIDTTTARADASLPATAQPLSGAGRDTRLAAAEAAAGPASTATSSATSSATPTAASTWASSAGKGGQPAADSGLSDTAAPRPPADWQLALGRLPAAPSGTVALAPQQPTQWREPMLNALGEHVQWQLQRGMDQAVIRLEPPQMGRIDILIRQDANGLQVQLSATHREVVQQLHAVSDNLRQDLGQRQTLSVSVQVSDSGQRQTGQSGQGNADGQGQRPRTPQDPDTASPTRALQDTEDSAPNASFATHTGKHAAQHPELG